jgi:predicted secreted protein
MTRPILHLVIAFTLIISAGLSWSASTIVDRLASSREQLATLQPVAGAQSSRWAMWLERIAGRSLAAGSHQRTVPSELAADYWAGRYDRVLSSDAANEADDVLLLASANAAFRKAQREASPRAPSPDRLDHVLQAYAGVLKNGGFNRDAAYNYEYVARVRDNSARAKSSAPSRQTPPRPTASRNDDLPAGPTVHGAPGTHPPGSKGEEFEIMTPMDYGEREAQPEATPGRPLPRKG